MAEQALVVNMGRLLTARLLKGDGIEGITHCALGDGDATFTDPNNPPAPAADQTTLKNEFIRKRAHRTAFLVEDPEGDITVDGQTYAETETETVILGVFFRFDDYEATVSVIKEIGCNPLVTRGRKFRGFSFFVLDFSILYGILIS